MPFVNPVLKILLDIFVITVPSSFGFLPEIAVYTIFIGTGVAKAVPLLNKEPLLLSVSRVVKDLAPHRFLLHDRVDDLIFFEF